MAGGLHLYEIEERDRRMADSAFEDGREMVGRVAGEIGELGESDVPFEIFLHEFNGRHANRIGVGVRSFVGGSACEPVLPDVAKRAEEVVQER